MNGKGKKGKPTEKDQDSHSILVTLFVSITACLFLMALSVADGQAVFPKETTYPPYKRNHSNLPPNHDIIIKSLSMPGLSPFVAYFWHQTKNIPISPWHDISLHNSNPNNYNFVVEIPKGHQAKLEIQRDLPLNPIRQDRLGSDKLRFVPEPYPCNYGAFPQTWENPGAPDKWTGLVGDKDPLDVCELGSRVYLPGDVVTVKILGVLGLLGDGDETDWKIFTLDINDPLADKWDNVDDIPLDLKETIVGFYTFYKVGEGHPTSKFAFNGQVLNKTFATTVIKDKHNEWQNLVKNHANLVLDGSLFSTQCTLCPKEMKKESSIKSEEAKNMVLEKFTAFLLGN